MRVRLMYGRFFALMMMASASCPFVVAQSKPEATAASGTPTIDGEIDEAWHSAKPVLVCQRVELDGQGASANTFSRVRFLWDKGHLYLLWHVADNTVSSSHGAPWERDSVEWFVDENRRRTGSYEKDDVQYRVGADGRRSGGKNFSLNNIKAAVQEIEGGYRVEASMRFRTIEGKDGQQIGIELQVNDDVGKGRRDAIVKWADPSDRSWFDTSQFGRVVLEDKPGGIASDPAEDLSTDVPAITHSDHVAEAGTKVPVVPRDRPELRIPSWAAEAVFYQVFPERFCNGDPSNDPTRESLEFVDIVPESWRITPWTSDWYARADWERRLGDSFYDDGVFHRRYGGDLQGVLDRLEYLQRLGINVIYFNPVFHARSLHKYDGTSYHHVDPYFGPDPAGDLQLMERETSDPATWAWTAADRLFLKVVQSAHDRGIHVIIDGVFNHTGRDFFAFDDLREKQRESAYVDWYSVECFDDPSTAENEFRYQCWWGVDTLPEFANDASGTDLHHGPKQYILDATARWMDPDGDGEPRDGIDGWRLDVANEVPDEFWRDWHRHVRKLNPEAYTVAEIWDDASDYLERCEFSATMNYHGFAFLVKGFLLDGRLPADQFAAKLQQRASEHSWEGQLALQNLVDSHDTDRMASMIVNRSKRPYLQPHRFDYDVGERASPRHSRDYQVRKPNAKDREIQKLAVLFQMTYVGAPMVYYGSEAGMWGGDDPDDRKPMVWPELQYDRESHDPRGKPRDPDPVAFEQELYDFYRSAIALRREHVALQRGQFVLLHADGKKQVFVFARQHGDKVLVIALNRSDQAEDVTVDLSPLQPISGLEPLLSTARSISRGVFDGSMWQLSLAEHAGTAFSARTKTK